MNPIESYRDPGLDGLHGPQSSTTTRKTSRHSRQPSSAARDLYAPTNSQYDAGTSGSAPIAYPGADLSGQGLQRSFSQRARGRPYAEEAFADEDLADTARDRLENAQQQLRQVTAQDHQSAHIGPVPSHPVTQPDPGQAVRRQQIIQDNIRSAAQSVRSPKDMADTNTYDESRHEVPGLTKAPTLKTVTNQAESRDWAPDRSPLQKLEATLDNISKEEKRARVQEAEMLHREKTRSQRPPERQPNPSTIEDAGIIRSLSNTQKDRLHHSTVIESRQPDAARLSTGRPGFDYQNATPLPRSVTITRRSRGSGVGHPTAQPQRAASSSHAYPPQDPVSAAPQARSVSLAHSTANPTPASTMAAQQSQKYRAKPVYDSDRIPTAQERNASHRAALESLTGHASTAKSDSGSRRTRDPSFTERNEPTGPSRNLDNFNLSNPARFQSTQQAPSVMRIATPQGQSIPAGLGFQDSPGVRSVDSATPADNMPNPVQRHKRRSSVSFKDPYDRRRPLDEWKAAETARLSADDFVLEPKQNPESNKAWWEEDPKSRRTSNRSRTHAVNESAAIDDRNAEFRPRLLLKCGPLLRYTGIKRTIGEGAKEYWRGTVMIVTQDQQSSYEKPPTLRLFSQPKSLYNDPHLDDETALDREEHDPLAGSIKMSRIGRALYVKPAHSLPSGRDLSHIETDDGLFDTSPPIANTNEQSVAVTPIDSRLSDNNGERNARYKEIRGARLYADPDRDVTFWLFKIEVQLGKEQQHLGYRINGGAASGFWVPSEGQTMNIMFHSCNGFSLSVNPHEFSGPDPLWRDVLIAHQRRPFHVMIGGGDQIYNDRVMRDTQLFGDWTASKNPQYKHNAPFTTEMKEELETFYLDNYSQWFSQGLFAMAGSQIPMVNMWDDHDIIDGFGSYPHPFMISPVFSGVGNIAYKYYMLFQQHSVEGMTSTDEPSWVLGYKPGPYIKQLSRSIFLNLGRPIAFLALDCRTERMKNQVLSLDTCDIALERCRKEIIEGETKHLIVLLGVPIAYPRMNWLETILTSRAMDPVKALGRYGMIKGGLLNKFDGGVEVLDDLDDHWTAHHHKEERNELIKELQDLAAERSVRVTILGGDVHLGAIGQFYSNPRLKIPKDRDHRYMPNVISSAIVNTPPPEMLADVLNKRNKVHHLDGYTDESMIPMFTHDVDRKKRNNKHLLPRRNWCSITEYRPGITPSSSRSTSPSQLSFVAGDDNQALPQPKRRFSLSRDDINPRMLFRRLSSRNAPPTAYREDGFTGEEQRYGSLDDVQSGRNPATRQNGRLGMNQRAASETRDISTQGNYASGDDEFARRGPPPFRPGFHRRPTNLSEKAAKKGNMPAMDAEGNEFDLNDHVNLDGALDVVLNCEIDRRDPCGATEPYRLLVPALWYDGSSDREKLEGAEGLQRKPTLMNKLGFGGKRGQKSAQSQGAGNWGQDMSDAESYTGSEEGAEAKPKARLGLFRSLSKKRPENNDNLDRSVPDHTTAVGTSSEPNDYFTGAHRLSFHDQATGPATSMPHDTPAKMTSQAAPITYEMPHDTSEEIQGRGKGSFNQPPSQPRDMMAAVPQRTSSGKGNVLQEKSQRAPAAVGHDSQQMTSPSQSQYQTYDSRPQPQSQPQFQPQRTVGQAQGYPQSSFSTIEPIPANPVRRGSYTIGTNKSSSLRQPSGTESSYANQQQRQAPRAASTPTGPPSSYPAPGTGVSADSLARSSSLRGPNSGTAGNQRLSKQEQVLGIGTDHDAYSGNPQQRSLRGNGILGRTTDQDVFPDRPQQRSQRRNSILGRFGLSRFPPSAEQVPQVQQTQPQHTETHTSSGAREDFPTPTRTTSQGYSGVEAYREKPKRGLSLRDRARNFIDRVEGRNKREDDYDDDGQYPYSDEGSYSDDVGETQHGQSGQLDHHQHQHPQSYNHHHDHNDDNIDEQDRYSDEPSYFSDEEEPIDTKPKRGLSQRFKGMMRMGSNRGNSQRREMAAEEEEGIGDSAGGGGGAAGGGSKYY